VSNGRTTALALGLCVLFLISHKTCTAQGVSGSPQSDVVLAKLVPPIYPPVARATRITGDVDLVLTVRPDGGVDSVVVASGHPLLKESAVTSARLSQFECRACTEQVNKYRLVYTFNIEGECECEFSCFAAHYLNQEKHRWSGICSDRPHQVLGCWAVLPSDLGFLYQRFSSLLCNEVSLFRNQQSRTRSNLATMVLSGTRGP